MLADWRTETITAWNLGRKGTMKGKTLKELWGGLLQKTQNADEAAVQAVEAIRVTPLTARLRIDMTVPNGAGKEVAASHFIWVSPAGSNPRSVKALRVLLLPN